MKLSIRNETDPLTDVCICRGESVPNHEGYSNDHPEFAKYVHGAWDKRLFVEQQDRFFELLDAHGVRLHRVAPDPALPWQTYTRDVGFVVGDRLFYCADRGLPEREGEIDRVRAALDLAPEDCVAIAEGRVEGGDVIPFDGGALVGISARSNPAGVAELARHIAVTPLRLREDAMHLDTRFAILPGGRALIHAASFRADDIETLSRRFTLIPVTDDEAETLGPNVVVIDPETVVAHRGHARIADEIEASGLRALRVDYSEPVALRGSLHCSTMPLARA